MQTTHNKKPTSPSASLHLTPSQQTILHHLYRYRFLNRHHIQQLLNHKNHKPIHAWLNDLTNHNVIGRIYSPHFPDNTKPAIYYLKSAGIAWLRNHGEYDLTALRTRYRDHQRTATFRQHCLTVATLSISLRGKEAYELFVPSDYATLPAGRILANLAPQASMIKREDSTTQHYLLELLNDLSPARLRARVKQYLAAYEGSEWEAATSTPFPTVCFVFSTLADLIATKRWLRRKAKDESESLPNILFTTVDEMTTNGITSEIWEGL